MKLAEFVKSSERTMASNLHIDSNIKVNLLHSAVGVATEVGEIMEACNNIEGLDMANIAEEAADLSWYLAIPIRDFGLDISLLDSLVPVIFSIEQLIIDSANYLDMMKKIAFYGKDIDSSLIGKHVCNLYVHMLSMANSFSFDLELAMSNNQDKLKARFPDKYDNEKALNRDLNTERTELEKGM